ncbi:hypothetical protein Zm00014a_009935 [Zea mays]|uniref:Uncharacterized protein n=1 Tax=Zea mays TaxID=4577 RepID=A0A3L6EJJ9_MAIZE|nr:hypothetical protein Zm00014a_009935 [Zea mays]
MKHHGDLCSPSLPLYKTTAELFFLPTPSSLPPLGSLSLTVRRREVRRRTVRIHLLFTGAPPVLARRCSPPRRPWTRWSSCLPSTQHRGWTSRLFPTRQDHRTHRPSSRHMSENLRLKQLQPVNVFSKPCFKLLYGSCRILL